MSESVNDYLARRRPTYLAIARRMSNMDDAEDMAQEMMLEVADAMAKRPGKDDTYYNRVAAYACARVIKHRRLWTSMKGQQGSQFGVDLMRDGRVSSMDFRLFDDGDDKYNAWGVADESGYADVEAEMVLAGVANLTPRLREITEGFARGDETSEIAEDLGLSYYTVRNRWNREIKPRLLEQVDYLKGAA